MPTETDRALERLDVLLQERPELHEIGFMYEAIFPLLHDLKTTHSAFSITPAEIQDKLAHGQPLLQDVDLEYDTFGATSLMTRLARIVEDVPPGKEMLPRFLWILGDRRKEPRDDVADLANDDLLLRATAARQIRLLLEKGDLDVGMVLRNVSAGDIATIIAMAEDLQLDPGLVWTIAYHALMPELYAVREQFLPMVDRLAWEKSYCYFCGADAMLADVYGDALKMDLNCGQCGATWSVPRGRCVYCHNAEKPTLATLKSNKEGDATELQMCDRCNGYTKIAMFREPEQFEMLIVHNLATIDLDLEAQDRGFKRGRGIPEQGPDF